MMGISESSLVRVVWTCLIVFLVPAKAPDERGAVTINADFPGGNVAVLHNEGGTAHVAPDLRGDNPWFYWYFEAKASKVGRVNFVFPETVAGFKNGAIGFQGPAISTDLGKTWKWMGTDRVDGSSFFYDFAKADQRVRFAVTIPYLQAEWDEFLSRNANSPHFEAGVLTKSRHGRNVELLQIGKATQDVKFVLVTGRHHAAETMASYILEGFLEEAMSDSPSGEAFRKRYVLYAVPFVDKDGVEEGDQGKNRRPHDHNRDYGEKSIYPEVQAIKELDKEVDFQFALDFHCPTLIMNDHQVIENVSEFARQIKVSLPKDAPYGPLNWLRDDPDLPPMNSRYFGFKVGAIMSATIEFPFAPPNKATDPESCRKYGQVMLRAWINTHFRAAD
jgi:hypothetical protein